MRSTGPLRQHLILAMQGRGTMLTKAIYCAVKERCDGINRPLPSNWQSDIRQILQAQCASRPQYKGGADIFIYHRRGHWSCTAKVQVDLTVSYEADRRAETLPSATLGLPNMNQASNIDLRIKDPERKVSSSP